MSPPAWEALEFHCLLLMESSLFNLSHGHGGDRISLTIWGVGDYFCYYLEAGSLSIAKAIPELTNYNPGWP